MEQEGFFPVLIGGLGNQLFILVASYVCSRVYGCPLYIPSSISFSNPHLNTNTDYVRTLFSHFGKVLPEPEHVLQAGPLQHYSSFKPKGFGPWFPHQVKPAAKMESYFQYYPPLAPYEQDIRAKLLKGLDNPEPSPHTAFLHIRRGDYLKYPAYHFIQNMDYYAKAVDLLLTKNSSVTCIKIFSDDIAWAKEQPFFSSRPELFVFVEQEDEYLSLREMTTCHGGAVLANSTFSWWAAFLGPYAVRAPIFYPSRWIAEDVPELCPSEWICI